MRDDERLKLVRWCHCGRPWIAAGGLYGTTEQVECSTCVLQKMLKRKEAEIVRLQEANNERQDVIEAVTRELEQTQILCLQMADWCGFWNSGCANRATIDQLRAIRDQLYRRGIKW